MHILRGNSECKIKTGSIVGPWPFIHTCFPPKTGVYYYNVNILRILDRFYIENIQK